MEKKISNTIIYMAPFKKGKSIAAKILAKGKSVRFRSKRTKPKSTQLVTKAVLYKAIRKNVETKQATAELPFTYFNSAINSTAEYYTCLPGLGQGVGANQRLGDQIRPIKIVIRGYVNYATNAYTEAALIIARHFVFQPKNVRYQPQTSTAAGIYLLTNGGNPSNFTGALLDITRPHNNEEFIFYQDKRRTFLKPWGITNNATPSVTTDITGMDRSLVQFFEITLTQKQIPAVLKYNASFDTFPINFNPLMAMGYAYSTNAVPDLTNTKLGMSYSTTMFYEDA